MASSWVALAEGSLVSSIGTCGVRFDTRRDRSMSRLRTMRLRNASGWRNPSRAPDPSRRANASCTRSLASSLERRRASSQRRRRGACSRYSTSKRAWPLPPPPGDWSGSSSGRRIRVTARSAAARSADMEIDRTRACLVPGGALEITADRDGRKRLMPGGQSAAGCRLEPRCGMSLRHFADVCNS
jgi:hypothetical protein